MIDRMWKVVVGTVVGGLALSGVTWILGDTYPHDWGLIFLMIFLHLDLAYTLQRIPEDIGRYREWLASVNDEDE